MEYTHLSVDIDLCKTMSDPENLEEMIFPPFDKIEVYLNETYRCPFCGTYLDQYNLGCCEEFRSRLTKLREAHNDKKHESRLHFEVGEYVHDQAINSLNMKLLSKEEILALGPDVWDYAKRVEEGEYAYFIADESCDGKKVRFLCKNLKTKSVYRCVTDELTNLQREKIGLGVMRTKKVAHGKRLGNYGHLRYWDNIADFENWDEFCEALVKMWFIQSKMPCNRAFFRLKYLMNKQANHQI